MSTDPLARGRPMIDPAGDNMDREWCYSPKSLTWIGVPFQPYWTQVTFDGALYSLQQAELCFFYGRPLKPLLARQKTFHQGWIPIIEYDWQDGDIHYAIEMFAAVLAGRDETNTVNFVRVTMENRGSVAGTASFAAALRNCGEDGRWLQWSTPQNFDPDWTCAMTDDAVLRDERLVYTFSPGAMRESVPGVAYTGPFVGAQYHLTSRAEACLVRYQVELAPGETYAITFRMPRVPVPVEDKALVDEIRLADHDTYRQQTIAYWQHLYEAGMQVEIPEARVQNAFRANLVHLVIGNRDVDTDSRFRYMTHDKPITRCQTSGLNYPDFFGNDYVDMRLAYDVTGHAEWNMPSIDAVFAIYSSLSTRQGPVRWTSWGQIMHSLAHHYFITRDEAYARRVYPYLRNAVELMQGPLQADEYGLVPEVHPYDNEMIQGHYASHNWWCLLGLRSAIRLARALGEEVAADWLALHDWYTQSIERALQASAGADGYVPTGLYTFRYGKETRGDVPEILFNNDWENVCLVWPTEVLEPNHPRVTATLEKVHRLDYREGVLGYHNAYNDIVGDIHGYSGHSVLYQLIARGDQAQALTDLYYLLLHCGSTYEIWEQGGMSWTNRESAEHTAPHTWAAARMIVSIRNMLVMELGGRAGLEEDERDLHLFSVVSPAWTQAGQHVAFRNAVTEMGRVSATLRFMTDGAELRIESAFHHPPRHLVVHVPYFVELEGYQTDARWSRLEGDRLLLSPEATQVMFRWHERTEAHVGILQRLLEALRAEPSVTVEDGKIVYVPAPEVPPSAEEAGRGPERLSFRLVLDVYRHEYARRYREYLEAGGVPAAVEAPAMLTAEERQELFAQQYGRTNPGN